MLINRKSNQQVTVQYKMEGVMQQKSPCAANTGCCYSAQITNTLQAKQDGG
jgi:hypothetical protein